MSDNLFTREVHQDKKGFFVFFGGYRYRPSKWLRHTATTLGKMVKLDPKPYTYKTGRHYYTGNHLGYVFIDGHKETWTIGSKHKLAIPQSYLNYEAEVKARKKSG